MKVDWTPLRKELAAWREEARALPLWWRDDDAVTDTPQLQRLIAMAEAHALPVHIAVIPDGADDSLVPFLEPGPLRAVVHGWAHRNNAPEGMKKSEFGTPREAALTEASNGLRRLRALFSERAYPMFVPPWNRIDESVIEGLHSIGYRWISTFLPRSAQEAAPGLTQINTHIDPVAWRGTRGLADPDVVLAKLVTHLQDRRSGRADVNEPLGLLTHHLMQDEATWAFCDALLTELRAAPLTLFDIQKEGHAP